jgi:hypothetical protein
VEIRTSRQAGGIGSGVGAEKSKIGYACEARIKLGKSYGAERMTTRLLLLGGDVQMRLM